MTEQNVEKESLEALTARIVQKANDADDRIIEAALLIREARARIESGEIGEVKWYEWALENIHLKETRLRELQRIAEADDPKKELEWQREQIRERVEKHRQKKKAEPPAPLRNGGEKPAQVIAKPQEGRQKSIGDGQEHGEDPLLKPKAAAPLRNGGTKVSATAEIEEDRQHLINWARSAQLERIQEVLSFIEGFEATEAGSHSGESAAPAAA